MQNLSRRFYDSILARIFYCCPVEWRQNGRAFTISANAIRIEDFGDKVPLEKGLVLKSVTLLNNKHAFFSYRDLNMKVKIGRFDLAIKEIIYNVGEHKNNGRYDIQLISTKFDKTLIFCMAYCDKPYFAQAN